MTMQPYREAAPVQAEAPKPRFQDATPEEIAFWERVYAACIGYGQIVATADRAIEERRRAFGHDTSKLTPYECDCGTPTQKNDLCKACTKELVRSMLR